MKLALFISGDIGIKMYEYLILNKKNINLIIAGNSQIYEYFMVLKINVILYNNNIDNIIQEFIKNKIELGI